MNKHFHTLLWCIFPAGINTEAEILRLFSGSGSTANGPVLTFFTGYQLHSGTGTVSMFLEDERYSFRNFRGLSIASNSSVTGSDYACLARMVPLNMVSAV